MVKDDQTIWQVLKFQSSADGEGWPNYLEGIKISK